MKESEGTALASEGAEQTLHQTITPPGRRGHRRWRLLSRSRHHRRPSSERRNPGEREFEHVLLDECGAMIRFASTQGMEIPPHAASVVRKHDSRRTRNDDWHPDPHDAAEIANAHWSLSKLLEPVTPKSITLLNQQTPKREWVSLFGAVRIVRVMMVCAIVFLVAFLVLLPIAVDNPVAAIAAAGAQRGRTWGEGFLNALYILCAAGLGVVFSQLYRINRQISRGRYDPTEDAVNMTTVVLGLISGVVLAILLPDVLKGPNGGRFSQPLLALLGGFSAPAVHAIVSRIVETLGTLVGGDPRDQAASETQEAVSRAKAAAEQDRKRIAAQAIRIDALAERDNVPPSLRTAIRAMLTELVPGMESEPTSHDRRTNPPAPRPGRDGGREPTKGPSSASMPATPPEVSVMMGPPAAPDPTT